jgi:hypothetical protein
MVSFIAFIITFYLFIPTFRRMDRNLHRKGDGIPTRIWKFLFHDGVDGELLRVRTELDHLGETMIQQRSMLSDPSTGTTEKQQIAYTLDRATRNYVRLVRRYEVDMTDDEFDRAMLFLHRQTGTEVSGFDRSSMEKARIIWLKNSI